MAHAQNGEDTRKHLRKVRAQRNCEQWCT